MEGHQNVGIHFLCFKNEKKEGPVALLKLCRFFFLCQLSEHTVKIDNAHCHSVERKATVTQTHPSAVTTEKQITGRQTLLLLSYFMGNPQTKYS